MPWKLTGEKELRIIKTTNRISWVAFLIGVCLSANVSVQTISPKEFVGKMKYFV
jgi:hypothetical protein